jgi:hypothetical protein
MGRKEVRMAGLESTEASFNTSLCREEGRVAGGTGDGCPGFWENLLLLLLGEKPLVSVLLLLVLLLVLLTVGLSCLKLDAGSSLAWGPTGCALVDCR